MGKFAPVWVSTDEQIERLQSAFRGASLTTKLCGTYRLPEGAAHLRGLFTPWMRVPLVFVAAGRAEVGAGRLAFVSSRFRAPGWRVRGVIVDLAFSLAREDIHAVEAADQHSPFARLFDLPFTRLRTRLPAPLDNFLVCVGGRFSMPSVRKHSLELRTELLAFAAAAPTPQ